MWPPRAGRGCILLCDMLSYTGGRKINWQLNDTPCEDDKRHLVAQEEVSSEGLCNEGLMTIHKRFSVRWSTRLGSSALESRRCHFPSPQKGAAIDGVGCEREITQNPAPGPSQVTCRRMGGGGHTHLAHYRCHRGTKNSESGSSEYPGLTAADTFSHESEFGALFFCSAPYPVRIIELTELRGGHLRGLRHGFMTLPWSIGDKFERPLFAIEWRFKCEISREGCSRPAEVKGLIDDLLPPPSDHQVTSCQSAWSLPPCPHPACCITGNIIWQLEWRDISKPTDPSSDYCVFSTLTSPFLWLVSETVSFQ